MKLPTSDIHEMAVEELDTSQLLAHAARQRDEKKFQDFLIIDVDCHHYENESLSGIAEFIEDPVIKHGVKMATIKHGAKAASAGGTGVQASYIPSLVGYQDLAGRITRYPLRKSEKVPASDVHRDVQLTLRWMDAMGVDYVCMFPTPMLAMGVHPQTEVEVHMARAYNRWLTEKILASEPRLRSMLYLLFNDPEASYKMVQDFGANSSVLGFMVTSVRYNPVYDDAYMKTYSLLEELGKPLAFHAGYSWSDQMLATTNRLIVTHVLGFTFFNIVHCANWIANGLPERFPKLKVMWIEAGLAWVPFLMQRMDNDYKMRSSECPSLKRLPSEYMREMYYSSQPLEIPDDLSVLETTFKMINAETQLLWASDYPRWDMDLPSKIYDIPFLSEQSKRNILGDNARKLFNLDVSDRFPNL